MRRNYFGSMSDTSISDWSSTMTTDIDNVIGFWIENLPYIWKSDGTLENSHRLYFANVDDTVYIVDSQGAVYVPKKQYLLEYMAREGSSVQAYRVRLNTPKPYVMNLFRVVDPYANIPSKVQEIDIRINGKSIDPIKALVPEVQRVYAHHLHFEPLASLRYQDVLPSSKELTIVHPRDAKRNIIVLND